MLYWYNIYTKYHFNELHLKGFAVISCTAAHLRASIPWLKIEKEPIKLELVGLQLICVPLLPSNATKIHGAGTDKDPKCTLRTRVKRSAIARFERNFFSWRIPGEGPPRPKAEKRRTGVKKKSSSGGDSVYSRRGSSSVLQQKNTHDDDDRSMFTTEHDFQDDLSEMTSNSFDDEAGELDDKDEKQQAAWKEKFVQKLVRNIEMSVRDLHVRCEVGERALNSGPEQKHTKNNEEESSFAFGFQFDALVLKSANSSWNTGRNVDFKEQDSSQRKETISVAGKESVIHDTKYKVFMLKNMSMYWDDSPPIILSETPLLQNPDKCDAHKIWSTIRLALNNMKDYQDPGEEIRNVLMGKMETNNQKMSMNLSNSDTFDGENELLMEHSYVISPTTIEVRMKLHNLGLPGRTHCQAELMPCKFNFNFNPKQMRQYRAIQYAMFAQQRLDTMLHQRPTKSPIQDPLAWWKYAISCVTVSNEHNDIHIMYYYCFVFETNEIISMYLY